MPEEKSGRVVDEARKRGGARGCGGFAEVKTNAMFAMFSQCTQRDFGWS
jgi:hypothetical protein